MGEIPTMEERFTGCLLGAAVGDAVGFCLLSRTYDFNFDTSRVQRQDVREFQYFPAFGCPPGQFTDDTLMSLALANTILKAGKVCPDTLTSELMDIWQGGGCGPPEEVTSIIKGAMREDEGGPVPGAGNEAAARAAPLGLWNWQHPQEIAADSRAQSRPTHADPMAAVGAAIVAQGVASSLRREGADVAAFLEDIVPGRGEDGARDFISYLLQIPEWLRMSEELAMPDIARAGQDDSFGTFVSPFVLPSVLISLYAFLRCPEDFCGSLAIAYRAGGDINSTGSITGALSGARCGKAGIPDRLLSGLMERDEIEETARRLLQAAEKRG